MNAKYYLGEIRRLNIKINNKLAEKESLFSLATKITPTLSKSGGGSGTNKVSDKVGDAITKICDLEVEINNTIDNFVTKRNKIIKQLEAMENEKHYDLLHKRYIQYKDFSIVAKEMGYDYQTILNMHGEALKSFGKKFL